jgi:hypothetical protein
VEAPVVPSLAAPPAAEPTPAAQGEPVLAQPEPEARPAVSHAARVARRRARAEAKRGAEQPDDKPPAQEEASRTKEMHGVPIVEKPAF